MTINIHTKMSKQSVIEANNRLQNELDTLKAQMKGNTSDKMLDAVNQVCSEQAVLIEAYRLVVGDLAGGRC